MSGAARHEMNLGVFVEMTGRHLASWRHQQVNPLGPMDFAHYRQVAEIAERGLFDLFFLADGLAIRDRSAERLGRGPKAHFEPITLLSALSQTSRHIGLIATASTTFNEPFHIARKFASLDFLSGGRAGWNIVTSSSDAEAENFGAGSIPPAGERYRRAGEFVDVVRGLWDSWDDDAIVAERDAGVYFRPEGLHALDHRGEFFSVRGPLNIARPPQGHPLLVQAGSSVAGMALGASVGEVIYTAQTTLADAQSFYGQLKSQARAAGRSARALRILPGLFPVVGRTRGEAQEKFDYLQSLIHPEVGLAQLEHHLGGIDLSGYPLDGPLPDLPAAGGEGANSRIALLRHIARRDNLTIRDLYLQVAIARGHPVLTGTAADIADMMTAWFQEGGADGFNIMPGWLPGGLADFVDLVVPELQRRGVYRRRYQGATTREIMGLARPASRYAARDHY
ncbi:LLM class flavin-dependent oxidoreductase [Sodalis sp. RH19]|uniref:LLM class flavin-dependent oxidoreductase n=1 Tax=unclassified Sodalis (in: enterobacteria) TaxID=2636512 RepID=UPI0039B58BBE